MLEARHRVGGRVRTVYAPFTDGLHAESGGESIDDNHDQIQAMVTRFGLHTERRLTNRDANSRIYFRGRSSPAATFLASDPARARRLRPLLHRELQARRRDRPRPSGAGREREPGSIARASRTTSTASVSIHAPASSSTTAETGEYASDPRNVSLLFYAQQEAVANDVLGRGVRDDAHPRREQPARAGDGAGARRGRAARRAGPIGRSGARLRDGARRRAGLHAARSWCSQCRHRPCARSGSHPRCPPRPRRWFATWTWGPRPR